eukprot:COSAG06_NODE_1061_length_10874_cov_7.752390_15_plen_129_part_01
MPFATRVACLFARIAAFSPSVNTLRFLYTPFFFPFDVADFFRLDSSERLRLYRTASGWCSPAPPPSVHSPDSSVYRPSAAAKKTVAIVSDFHHRARQTNFTTQTDKVQAQTNFTTQTDKVQAQTQTHAG